MQIKFNNTYWDIVKFTTVHQFKYMPIQFVCIFLAMLIFYSEYDHLLHGVRQTTFISAFTKGLFWYVIIWILQFFFNAIFLYSRKNKSVITEHIVEILDDSFYEETPYNRSYFYWNGIVKVIKISSFIGVYLTPHMAVIIPDRAFSSKKEKEDYYNQLKNKLQSTA